MKPQVKIPLLYFVFGVLWILVSDHVAAAIARGPAELQWLQTAKGWVFVGVTTLLLNLCIRNHMRRIAVANEAKVEAFHRTMRGVQHIMNSVLNRMLRLRAHVEQGSPLDEPTSRELDALIDDTSNRITQLSESEESDAERLATSESVGSRAGRYAMSPSAK